MSSNEFVKMSYKIVTLVAIAILAIGVVFFSSKEFLGPRPDAIVHVTIRNRVHVDNREPTDTNIILTDTFNARDTILTVMMRIIGAKRGDIGVFGYPMFGLTLEEFVFTYHTDWIIKDQTTLSEVIQSKNISPQPDGSYHLSLEYVPKF